MVTTSGGQIARYRPGDGETDYLADGFDQLYGVAIGPGDTIVFAELGTGRVHALRSGNVDVLASGLLDPVGVAFGPDGVPLVAESGAGRVVRLASSSRDRRRRSATAAGHPRLPTGQLYIVDAGAKEVIAVDLASGERRTIAVGPAGRTAARRESQAAQGNAAVLRPAGPVRRHHRGPRRHPVCVGRRRRQRSGAARRT